MSKVYHIDAEIVLTAWIEQDEDDGTWEYVINGDQYAGDGECDFESAEDAGEAAKRRLEEIYAIEKIHPMKEFE